MDIRRLTRWTCCWIAAACALAASAQDGAPEPPDNLDEILGIEECIQIGLEYAAAVRTAKLSESVRRLNLQDARSAYMPTIRTQGAYFANDRIDFDIERENLDWRVTANYTLWDHGRRRIQLNQARNSLESAQTSLERNRQDLVLAVVRAYYRQLEAQKLVELDKSLLEASQQNAEKVRAFMLIGKTAVEADVAAAEVRVAADELSLLNDENALSIAQAQLPRTLGLPPEQPIQIADDPGFTLYQETGQFERYAKTLEETVAEAVQKRPAVKASELDLRFYELGLKRAARERLPQLTAQANYGVDLHNFLRERENFKQFRTWDAAARLTFPIFDAGYNRRQLDRANIDLLRAQELHEDLKRGISLDATQSYYNLKQAEKRLGISAVQVHNAQLNLDVTAEQYAQGLVILLELLDAQTQFGRAITTQVRAYYDYKIAQRSLERSVGKAAPSAP